MKPIHSKTAGALYPAPVRQDYPTALRYARACQQTEYARLRYDSANILAKLALRLIKRLG